MFIFNIFYISIWFSWKCSFFLKSFFKKINFRCRPQTYINYWQPKINNEVGCFSWWVDQALHKDVVMCYPVAKILDNTMNYFCGYMVSAMVSEASDLVKSLVCQDTLTLKA